MTKGAAIQAYFESFMKSQFPNLPVPGDQSYLAYASTNVPNDTLYPYLVYEGIDNDFDDGEVAVTVNLWFHTESESVPNAASRALREYIEDNDLIICDGGAIWVKAGSPWSTPLVDSTDQSLKRRYINITFEYLTR